MNKKLIFATVLLVMASVAASAQVKFGIRAGFTQSDASLTNIDTKKVAGYHVGLATQIGLPGGFGLQTGIAYQTKGLKVSKDEETRAVTLIDRKSSYGYLEVPLQLQWGLDLILVRPYVFVEGFGGYALNKKITQYNGADLLNVGKSDFKSKLEYGYAFGFGIDILKVQLSAKYFKNLGDLGDSTFKDTAGQILKNKNNFDGISISAVFFF